MYVHAVVIVGKLWELNFHQHQNKVDCLILQFSYVLAQLLQCLKLCTYIQL